MAETWLFDAYRYDGHFITGTPSATVTLRCVETNQRRDVLGKVKAKDGRAVVSYCDPSGTVEKALTKLQALPTDICAEVIEVRLKTVSDGGGKEHERKQFLADGSEHDDAMDYAHKWVRAHLHIQTEIRYAILIWSDGAVTTLSFVLGHIQPILRTENGREYGPPPTGYELHDVEGADYRVVRRKAV